MQHCPHQPIGEGRQFVRRNLRSRRGLRIRLTVADEVENQHRIGNLNFVAGGQLMLGHLHSVDERGCRATEMCQTHMPSVGDNLAVLPRHTRIGEDRLGLCSATNPQRRADLSTKDFSRVRTASDGELKRLCRHVVDQNQRGGEPEVGILTGPMRTPVTRWFYQFRGTDVSPASRIFTEVS